MRRVKNNVGHFALIMGLMVKFGDPLVTNRWQDTAINRLYRSCHQQNNRDHVDTSKNSKKWDKETRHKLVTTKKAKP